MSNAPQSVPTDQDTTPEFAELARLHTEALFAWSLQWSGNRDDAWDLVQDTYERAMRSDFSRVPAGRLRGWLFIVAKNLFFDGYRKSRRRRLTPGEEMSVVSAVHAVKDDEEEAPWRSITRDDLERALGSLKPDLANVWRLHTFERLSYGAIAERLRVPVGTIGTRILRARRKLRETLTEQMNDCVSLPARRTQSAFIVRDGEMSAAA
jgi:RNA polymerase sigma-70 factor (ECF subfamily)